MLDNLCEKYGIGLIPNYFNHVMLPKISREHIVYFDETHIEQEGGNVNYVYIQNKNHLVFHHT